MAEMLPAAGAGAGLGLGGYGLYALHKVVGPSLSRIGLVADRWVECRTRNVGRVAEKAARKAGPQLELPGGVPARVAARILEDGSYCDDDLMQEYFGGVLAASRTPAGRDDRGARWAGVVSHLSSYEVRLHYLLYREFRSAVVGADFDFEDGNHLHSTQVYIPWSALGAALDWEPGEAPVNEIADHAISGLIREGLLPEGAWACTPDAEAVQMLAPSAKEGGIVIGLTYSGVELFLWAHGHRVGGYTLMSDGVANFDLETPIPPIPGSWVRLG